VAASTHVIMTSCTHTYIRFSPKRAHNSNANSLPWYDTIFRACSVEQTLRHTLYYYYYYYCQSVNMRPNFSLVDDRVPSTSNFEHASRLLYRIFAINLWKYSYLKSIISRHNRRECRQTTHSSNATIVTKSARTYHICVKDTTPNAQTIAFNSCVLLI
jgi:hypothetical protein